MSTIDRTKALEDPAYRELYMKYLGTLRLLGEVLSRSDQAELCMAEEAEACIEDAREFLGPEVKLVTFEGGGFYLDLK